MTTPTPTIGKNRPSAPPTGGPTKVKVFLNKQGLVIPILNPDAKVESLLKDIAARFEGLGIKPGELRLAELRTTDGCLISLHDHVRDVIDHGETLEALDFETWVITQKPLLEKPILTITREDFEGDEPKFVQLGLHQFNKLYVKFGSNWPGNKEKMLSLELYDPESLKNFAKEGKILLGSKSGGEGKWLLEAYFIVKQGTVQEIELSAKSATDSKATIKRVPVKVDRKISLGETQTVQDPDHDPYNPAIYSVPTDNYTGPVISEEALKGTPQPEPAKSAAPSHLQAGGVSALQITQLGNVEADQTYERNGEWWQLFYTNLQILNKGESVLAVTKVKTEYQDKAGKWIEGTARTGRRSGYYNYSWGNENNTYFNMEPKGQQEMAVYLGFVMKYPQAEKDRRAHRSLPQPLHIRITFEESSGETAVINVLQANPPLELPTKESRETRNGKQFAFWAQCDDTDLESRVYVELTANPSDKRFEIYMQGSQGLYLYTSEFKKLAYQAKKAGTSELLMESPKYDSKHMTGETYAVVDLQNSRMYALKFVLKTTTSSLVSYYKLPLFE